MYHFKLGPFMPRVISIVLGAPFTFTAICDKIHAIGMLHTVQINLKDVDICIGLDRDPLWPNRGPTFAMLGPNLCQTGPNVGQIGARF